MDTAVRPRRWSLVVAALLHLLVLWLYALTGLVAPGSAVPALLALWVGFAFGLVVVQRRWGPLALLVPLVALGVWVAVVSAGSALLGWQA